MEKRVYSKTKRRMELINTAGVMECNLCHTVKPLSQFSKDKHKTCGHKLQCKECIRYIRQASKVFEAPKKKSIFKRIAEFFGVAA